MTTAWVHLEPLTPLTFRDGRGWGGEAGGESLDWPPPSQLLGAVCTAWGEAHGFTWDWARADDRTRQRIDAHGAPGISVIGPIPGRLRPGDRVMPLWPAPADRVVYPGEAGARGFPKAVALRPRPEPSFASAPTGLDAPLHSLGHAPLEKSGKPSPAARWMDHDCFVSWLATADARVDDEKRVAAGPLTETRTRLAIRADTHTAEDGALFRLGALDFPRAEARGDRWRSEPLGLVVGLRGLPDGELDAMLSRPWRLGGKGGLVRARRATPEWSDALAVVRSELSGRHRFRHVLAAPARFRQGWLPDWIGRDGTGRFPGVDVAVRLVAAAVPAPLVVSGWNLRGGGANRGGAGGAPRAARRLVPAGAVYFYEALDTRFDAASLVDRGWFEPCAGPFPPDDASGPLDARCGLGAGVFGAWNYLKENA